MSKPGEIDRLLEEASGGDPEALERLFPLVYDELRRMAEAHLRREAPGHTLQATALVHELYLKLSQQHSAQYKNRQQFFAIAARAVRRILVDHARKKGSEKRGGGAAVIPLDEAPTLSTGPGDTRLADLDEALAQLAKVHPRHAEIVELRYFAGLTPAEIAELLGLGLRTVERDWTFARAWLYRALSGAA